MPTIQYTDFNFAQRTLETIEQANSIIGEYVRAGYRLTLRQLYYQFVARGLLANKQSEYKRLGCIINDARLAGLIDWLSIEDRGRNLQSYSSWDSPSDIIESAAVSFKVDMWEHQPHYVEVWVGKEALLGVVSVACHKYRVPHFACKGYTSQSEMWEAGHNRLRLASRRNKELLVLHLGDHDPSGIDMTRDVRERLSLFAGDDVEVKRLALNMDQVEEWQPPPNPAKMTDSRFAGYVDLYGDESWELDALDPKTIAELIERHVLEVLDTHQWGSDEGREREGRESIQAIADSFDDVTAWLNDREQ